MEFWLPDAPVWTLKLFPKVKNKKQNTFSAQRSFQLKSVQLKTPALARMFFIISYFVHALR